MLLLSLGSSLGLGLLASILFFLLDTCSFLGGFLSSGALLISFLLLSLFLGNYTLAISLFLALFGSGGLILLFLLSCGLFFGSVGGSGFFDTFNDISVGTTIGLTLGIGGVFNRHCLSCFRDL